MEDPILSYREQIHQPLGFGSKQLPTGNTRKRLRRSTHNYILRAATKRHAQLHDGITCHKLGIDCADQLLVNPVQKPCDLSSTHVDSDVTAAQRREHLKRSLNFRQAYYSKDRLPSVSHKQSTSSWNQKQIDESHALARSSLVLPSDGHRTKPSLEREEAFLYPSTSKGSVRLRPAVPLIPGDEDAQVAELYRMGLLYDEQDAPAPAFDLNSISHEEPVYAIRPAKRARKPTHRSRASGPLHLNLSFTDLGQDSDLAKHTFDSTTTSSDDEAVASGLPRRSNHSRSSSTSSAPLRVIYELESAEPSFDLDTSQPPDLVDDILSDYDCFSESEFLEDGPSQREVLDSDGARPSEAWVILGDGS